MIQGRYLYVWSETTLDSIGKKHTQMKMKCYPSNDKAFTRNLKTKKVNKVMNKMKKEGWHILVKKPIENKGESHV